jgi:hypothetical protein
MSPPAYANGRDTTFGLPTATSKHGPQYDGSPSGSSSIRVPATAPSVGGADYDTQGDTISLPPHATNGRVNALFGSASFTEASSSSPMPRQKALPRNHRDDNGRENSTAPKGSRLHGSASHGCASYTCELTTVLPRSQVLQPQQRVPYNLNPRHSIRFSQNALHD